MQVRLSPSVVSLARGIFLLYDFSVLDSLFYPRSMAVVGASQVVSPFVATFGVRSSVPKGKPSDRLGVVREAIGAITREIIGKEFDFRRFLKELKIR